MELLQEWVGQRGTVRVFRQEFTLEDAIGSHAVAPLEALPCMRVTNGSPLGCPLFYQFTL